MTGCSITGCKAAATLAPKLMVPATGWAIDLHRPLSAILGMPLCDAHFAELKAVEFVQDEKMREVFRIMARASAGEDAPAPDFARAFFRKVHLASSASSEWATFEKAQAQAAAKGEGKS